MSNFVPCGSSRCDSESSYVDCGGCGSCDVCSVGNNNGIIVDNMRNRNTCTSYEERRRRRGIINFGHNLFASYDIKAPIMSAANLITGSRRRRRGCVEFMLRRVGQNVTLQWEPFEGTITRSGVSYLAISQYLPEMPSHSIHQAYPILLNGTRAISYLILDYDSDEPLKWYLHYTGAPVLNIDDSFTIPGGSIAWVASDEE